MGHNDLKQGSNFKINIRNSEVMPGTWLGNGSVIGKGVQSFLQQAFRPTFDGGIISIDMEMDPAELLQVTLVKLPMFPKKGPTFILRGLSCKCLLFFSGVRTYLRN